MKNLFLLVGFLNYLVGIKDTEHMLKGPMGGAIFENAVISEIIKPW